MKNTVKKGKLNPWVWGELCFDEFKVNYVKFGTRMIKRSSVYYLYQKIFILVTVVPGGFFVRKTKE